MHSGSTAADSRRREGRPVEGPVREVQEFHAAGGLTGGWALHVLRGLRRARRLRSGRDPHGESQSSDVRLERLPGPDYAPKVLEASTTALRKYGSGCSGSRLLNGTLDLHVKLEAELATLVRKDSAIIFGTGFQANYAALSALAEKGDVLLCDHTLHASLLEGAMRSTARTVRFRHNDLGHLERCLQNCSSDERVLIVSEGVFSMEGDLAELAGHRRPGAKVSCAHVRR